MTSTYCLLVPHYNHFDQFQAFLPKLLETELPIIIVDDGSEQSQLDKLNASIENVDRIHLFKHPRNRGKGAASLTGMTHACALGFTHAIQIDADGQHDINDIPRFVELSSKKPDTIICGQPVFDESAPKVRLYGRKVTDFWVALETLSFKIKDSLCGYRVYPIHSVELITDRYFVGRRMDFDTDILVKGVWADVDIEFLTTKVIYLEQSVSHFNYLRDNLLLIKLHTRLMFGMAFRLPSLLYRRIRS